MNQFDSDNTIGRVDSDQNKTRNGRKKNLKPLMVICVLLIVVLSAVNVVIFSTYDETSNLTEGATDLYEIGQLAQAHFYANSQNNSGAGGAYPICSEGAVLVPQGIIPGERVNVKSRFLDMPWMMIPFRPKYNADVSYQYSYVSTADGSAFTAVANLPAEKGCSAAFMIKGYRSGRLSGVMDVTNGDECATTKIYVDQL